MACTVPWDKPSSIDKFWKRMFLLELAIEGVLVARSTTAHKSHMITGQRSSFLENLVFISCPLFKLDSFRGARREPIESLRIVS